LSHDRSWEFEIGRYLCFFLLWPLKSLLHNSLLVAFVVSTPKSRIAILPLRHALEAAVAEGI